MEAPRVSYLRRHSLSHVESMVMKMRASLNVLHKVPPLSHPYLALLRPGSPTSIVVHNVARAIYLQICILVYSLSFD